MNVELVSKTEPNTKYFHRELANLYDNDKISKKELKEARDNLDAERLMIYIARVSSSRDNKLEEYEGLLNYLIDHGHWSPFQMADMTVEIETSRVMARQMIRHRSFKFQEFSQRYSDEISFEDIELRKQPDRNRQSSSEPVDDPLMQHDVERLVDYVRANYESLIDAGVSSETARMILPECTTTVLYMKGSVRSWIHYLDLRSEEATQKEHREVAKEIGKIFQREFPVIAKALNFNYE